MNKENIKKENVLLKAKNQNLKAEKKELKQEVEKLNGFIDKYAIRDFKFILKTISKIIRG